MASAMPGAMRSSMLRSSTATLAISTAIAGAAVVRNCRTAAACALSGEPLKRCARKPCTMSPKRRLSGRNGACARSQGINPFVSAADGRSLMTYTRCAGETGRTDVHRDEDCAALRVGHGRAIVEAGIFVALARLDDLEAVLFESDFDLRGEVKI